MWAFYIAHGCPGKQTEEHGKATPVVKTESRDGSKNPSSSGVKGVKSMSVKESGLEDANICSGQVEGIGTTFLLDTGATIFVVPDILVPEEKMLPDSVTITGVNGHQQQRRLAKVGMEAEGRKLEQTVTM